MFMYWLREGALEGTLLGDRAGWRVSEAALDRFMAERSNRATATAAPCDSPADGGSGAASRARV